MTVQTDRIDGWNLAAHDTDQAADLDGDGRAEIVIHSPEFIGCSACRSSACQPDPSNTTGSTAGNWPTTIANSSDGSPIPGRDEIFIRSPKWIGLRRWGYGAGAVWP